MSDTITLTEAARRLGVARSTVSSAIHRGTFPVPTLRIGKCVRIPRAKFDAFVAGDAPRADADGGPVSATGSPSSSQ